ncbi:MAG: hypothetical protein MZV63_45040 [Marinilabiliales bacterium]|nr:hypothetical protein [Marinilabiliales bacterium]
MTAIFPEKRSNIFRNIICKINLRYWTKSFGSSWISELISMISLVQHFTLSELLLLIYYGKPEQKLKATVGSGFKAPSLFNLYDPALWKSGLETGKKSWI